VEGRKVSLCGKRAPRGALLSTEHPGKSLIVVVSTSGFGSCRRLYLAPGIEEADISGYAPVQAGRQIILSLQTNLTARIYVPIHPGRYTLARHIEIRRQHLVQSQAGHRPLLFQARIGTVYGKIIEHPESEHIR
jgi:hypothetical protein